MLSDSAGRELGGAQHSFLCSPLVGASAGNDSMAGSWRHEHSHVDVYLLPRTSAGLLPRMPTHGPSVLSFHRGLFGLPHSVMAGFQERAPQRKPVKAG